MTEHAVFEQWSCWETPDGRVAIGIASGSQASGWPHQARQFAGLLVAKADAAEAMPAPEDVSDLASLVALAIPQDDGLAETVARCLLASGRVTLTGGGNG